ncbi:MAG: hypothetical protein ABSE70_08615 [Candidatus Limnocylindrales bacterium]
MSAPVTQSPAAPATAPPAGAMQVRFVGLTDGGTAAATLDAKGRPLLAVQIEVTGKAPLLVGLTANGLPAVDEGGRTLEAQNSGGVVPFLAEIAWSPPNGGGAYTLTATAMDSDKNSAEATIHITVTGVPAFTLPPALTREQALKRVTGLLQDTYKVNIPAPSLQRFEFPTNPTRSRWIGAAYYKGTRYYVQVFDDGHVEWSNGPYADPAHRSTTGAYTYCRPAGTYRVLVVFVDYGNTGTVKQDALAKVPVVVAWLNGLYADFATGQGFSSAPMRIEADAAYLGSPPVSGELLTGQQIRTLAGKDPSAYDFVMQIDLDANGTYGSRTAPGAMDPGGGWALEACGTGKFGVTNIWSSVTGASELQGGLVMDFNHELSHMFGMMDDWPPRRAVAGPAGSTADDWIPYVMFGWTDTDGDGIREIVDTTPYGTAGPKP